uniref:RING-type domain-containing protein n=1 Tax=Acrobeloides nanus TaxID=290746 RepID=A0A914CGV0_9BILA
MDISTCGVCLESTSDAICCILPDILDDSLEDAHKFCSDCTEKYIEVATFAQPLAEKSMGFPCMELDCDRIIPYESFSGMINETTREHFLERYKREIEEQRKEKTKEEHMKDEIEILQNQISKSLTLTCRACGVQYLKIDGCNVVKCRCGKKQCGLCGKLFESQFDSVHMNEKTIDYHSLTCQNNMECLIVPKKWSTLDESSYENDMRD